MAGWTVVQEPPKSIPDGWTPVAEKSPDKETGVLAGIKRNTVGVVSGLYHAFTDPPTEQEKSDLLQKIREENHAGEHIPEDLATNPSRATLAYHRLIDAPAGYLQKKGADETTAAKELLSSGEAWHAANLYASGLTDKGLSAVPLFGPWVNSVAQRAEKGDISGAATDLAAAVTAENIPAAAKAISPKVAKALDVSAAKNYEDVLNPTKQTTKFQTQKITPQLLEERPVALTRKGLAEKAGAQAEAAGQQIESTVQNLQGTMRTQPIVQGLQNLKATNQVNGVSLRPEVDAAIDSVSQQIQGMGTDISLQDAVKARRILDSAVAEAKGYQGAQLSDASMAAVRREAANSIRSELAQASPELAAVNQKFHFWNTLNDVLEQTIQRKTGQAPLLREMIGNAAAGGAGLASAGLKGAGTYGGAMYVLGKAFRSTAWKTTSAATKAAIADALVSGNFSGVADLAGKAVLGGQMAAEGQDQ